MILAPPPPPRLEDYRTGHRLVAGLGAAEILPDMDFETYSEAGYIWDDQAGKWRGPAGAPGTTKGLPVVGAEPYVRHPTFQIIWLAYDLKDGAGKRRWHPGMPPPADLLGYMAAGGVMEAWNVSFERWVWDLYCVPVLGWPAVREEQWRCAMAKARAYSLPGKLDTAGEVMKLATRKDKEGASLMKLLSMPRQPTKADPRRRQLPIYNAAQALARANEIVAAARAAEPGMTERKLAGVMARAEATSIGESLDTARYGDYNVTDIATEAEASSKIPDLGPDELAWWRVHERINRRGVHMDRVGVENCIAVVEQAFQKYNVELHAITGVDAASKVAQLQAWLHARGTHLDSLDEEHVTEALKNPLMPPDVRRVLEIRAAVGSASIKKLYSIRNRLSFDDYLRDLYVYYGARTGRSTGEGPQPTNLPKAGPDMIRCGCGQHYGQHRANCPFCGMPKAPSARAVEWNPDIADQAIAVMASRSLEWVEFVYGEALATIAGCLRAMFTAAPGHDLISTDYSSIEAVGLAMIAGEQWRKDVFNTHGKIYEASASTMFSVPLDDILGHKKATGQHHPLRAKGKIAELACLTPDTQVLTDHGYRRIVDVRYNENLWDGVEWVSHSGVVFKGNRRVIDLGGARMTPDHLVLCGTSWLEASQVVSSESTLCLAAATGSASLPSLELRAAGSLSESGCSVTAAHLSTSFSSRIWSAAKRLAARFAPTQRPAPPSRSTSSTPRSSPTTSTVEGCSIASLPQLGDATGPQTPPTPTTGAEASTWTRAGVETRASSFGTSSPSKGGTTQASTWTAERSMVPTPRGICASSPVPSTRATGAASKAFNDESSNLSDVYDIAHAGPRNRFTIRTNDGHLIVHNCGYQGWIGSAKAFDAPGTDEELADGILKWRAASPTIEWLWGGQEVRKATTPVRNAQQPGYAGKIADWIAPVALFDRWDRSPYYFGVEGMAVLAMLEPGKEHPVYRLDGTDSGISFRAEGTTLYCRIPSGRTLTYHNVLLEAGDRGGYAMSYEGWNTNPKNGPRGWIRMGTWGGRLVENINQATCRDILRAGCIALEAAGYPVVLHVYDEIVAQVPEGVGSIEEFEHIVTTVVQASLAWARDWPIRAPGGYRAKRYRKG